MSLIASPRISQPWQRNALYSYDTDADACSSPCQGHDVFSHVPQPLGGSHDGQYRRTTAAISGSASAASEGNGASFHSDPVILQRFPDERFEPVFASVFRYDERFDLVRHRSGVRHAASSPSNP